MFGCLMYLIDQTLKGDSGFTGGERNPLYPDITTKESNVNIRFFVELLYIVFAQQVIG